jgi:glycosyltransferase involved in cell wall biosynthesis
VTVGLFVYNGQRFLARSIQAILDQTFRDLALVICDNASTDASGEIARAFAGRDGRVRYVRQPRNVGAAANCNRAFELARSPYFKWAADDDVPGPRFIERCVEILDADASVVAAFTETRLIDEAGDDLPWDPVRGAFIDRGGGPWYPRHLTPPPVAAALASVDPVERFRAMHAHVRLGAEIFGVMRTEAVAKTGLHRPYYGSDRVLLAELSLLGRFITHGRSYERDALFFRRCHAGQSTSMTPREAALFMTGRAAGRVVTPEHVNILAGNANAVWRGALTRRQRLRCLAALLGHTLSARHLARLVEPTSRNYLVRLLGRYLGGARREHEGGGLDGGRKA